MKAPLNITIPEACHEQWTAMLPQDQGRFCGSCRKLVVDFTAMTNKELIEYFSEHKGSGCGRFRNDQLNRDINTANQKQRRLFRYVLNTMIPLLLISAKGFSQSKPAIKKATIAQVETREKPNVAECMTITSEPKAVSRCNIGVTQVLVGRVGGYVVYRRTSKVKRFFRRLFNP